MNLKKAECEMPYYKKPESGKNKIIFNCDRYCIVEILEDIGYEGFKKDVADFLYYDKKYGVPVATITKNKKGMHDLHVLIQQDASKRYNSLLELQKNASKFVQSCFRSIVGK